MMDENTFNELVDEIMSKGYDEATAAKYASIIGDTPLVDENGAVVIKDKGKELARLKLKFFGD